jgi:predicted nucleic acid-binding protein
VACAASSSKKEDANERVTERFVLDTSAIFTLTDQEEGSDRVEDLLDRAAARECWVEVCSVSLMELYYITLREKGEEEAAKLIGLVKSWPVTWVYPNEKALLMAGRIKAEHRLSIADALIAAVARLNEATLVHKDPELNALAGEVKLLGLPFKATRS